MIQVNVHQAKTQLSKLVALAEAGEEVVIARNGVPVVRIEVVARRQGAAPRRRLSGCMQGEVWTVDDREMAAIDAAIAASMMSGEPITLEDETATAAE